MDIQTRRKKQQALMVQMVERKVRSRAQQLYENRGQAEGQDLQDWFQAESEVTMMGSPTVASTKTSPNRPPSDGGTNLPQEIASL